MSIPFPVYFLVPSSILVLIIGFYTWTKSKKTENSIFFALTITQSVWGICTFMMNKSCGNDMMVIFWDRLLYLSVSFMIALLFHLSLEITKQSKLVINKILLVIAYISGFILAYVSTTNYLVNGVFYFPWGCHTYAQTGHHFFATYLVVFVILAIYNLFRSWIKEVDKIKRNQLFYAFLAFFIYSLDGLATVQAYGIGVYPFYYIFFPVFAILITYAITEKNLFVAVIATDLLIATILILVFTFLFFPEISFGLIGKIIIFSLLMIFCWLLLNHTHQETKRKEEAERISKLKTEFISIVSHQLRTPLAAIRGYAGMLKDGDYGPLPENTKTPIGYIHDSSVSMIKMVNGLLSITRLERGKVELKIQDVSIDELVQECINDVELTAKEKGLYLKYNKPKKIITIKGDPEKIKQAVINIINNALLYTPKGGVTVKISLLGEFINISIKDTGIGINEEDLGKIFQSFTRGKRGVELYTQGTGLGLYVAKSFIEMHNGKINVSSKGINKGSVFEIIIPNKTEITKKQEFNLFPNLKET